MPQGQEPIAIIGSACRLPGGSTSPSKLWELLRQPRDVLRPTPPERFSSGAYYHPDPAYHGTSNVQGSYFLDQDITVFDHAFFQIPPSEADIMDPQHRVLLETVYDALCDAGLTIESLRRSATSVFVGQMSDDWNVLLNKDMENVATYTATGSARSITANRISYFFDWRGPSMTIDTACSSSLVAVHQAVQTLLSGESRMAVAAGTNLILSPAVYIAASNLRMLSPSGRCRMWDADADGYGRGEGVAAVFLKTLSAALEDGDHIEGVIRATGVNQDGRTQGLMVPNGQAQAELIRSTYARAGLDLTMPQDRPQYFHAHGTGTSAGDTQEAEAIATALFPDGNPSPSKEKLLVGSVKTVIGHTEGAAGLASLIASSQALQNGVIPPNMLFNKLNPRIERFFEHLEIPTKARPWPSVAPGQPRRVSINSFGFGGTNAHVILESFDPAPRLASAHSPLIVPFVFSASSKSSLIDLLRRYLAFCQANSDAHPRDLAWTLHARRSVLPYRVAIPASSIYDLSAKLEDLLNNSTSSSTSLSSQRHVLKSQARIWGIFTGQGAQWSRMGARLIEGSDLARGYIARLDEVLAQLPPPDRPSWTIHDELLAEPLNSRISEAGVAQPLCTAVQVVLVKLLRLAGVKLQCVIGHSSGEIGAAYASGLISEGDAIRIAYYRGKFATMAQEGKRGAMLAVNTTLKEVEALSELDMFYGRVEMAAHNSPSTVVLSGDEDAIEEVADFFRGRRKYAQKLKVDTAYHSHHMIPCAERYAAALVGLEIEQPTAGRPVWYSSSSVPSVKMGKENLTPEHWAVNMTSPVYFFETVAHVLEAEGPPDLVVEFGPHPALKSAFASSFQNITANQNVPPYHGLLSRGQDDISQLASVLGHIWEHLGIGSVDFEALDQAFSGNAERNWMPRGLPQYSFNHSRSFGTLSRVSSAHIHNRCAPHPLLGKRCFESETTHQITWRNVLRPTEIPWLSGHQLQGQLVFPATAYLAMAMDSVVLLAKETPHLITLENVVIERGILFSDDEASVEIFFVVKVDRSNPTELSAEFACYSSLSNDTPMVRNVCGRIIAERQRNDMESPLQHVPKETYNLRPVTASRFYASLAKLGYEYQSPFRGIRSIQRKLGYAEGEIHDTSGSCWEDQLLLVHPGMMDSALQAISAASHCPGDGLAHTMSVPTRIDHLILDPKIAKKSNVFDFTSLVREASRGDTVADVYLATYNSPAEILLQIEGVHIQPLTPSVAENDVVMFSEFIYKPYDIDCKADMTRLVGEGVESEVSRVDQLMPWFSVAKLASQLAHRYPGMRILEVAGGHGEATQEIVATLDSAFSSYTFTDISSGAFGEVQDRTQNHSKRMKFKTFDINKCPVEQEFVESSLELVIAANSIGDPAAGTVEMALHNIRRLLRSGGHFLASISVLGNTKESASSTAHDMIWRQWTTRLQNCGFSLIDAVLSKPNGISSFIVIAAQAVDDRVNLLRDPLQHSRTSIIVSETLTIIGGKTNRVKRLVEELAACLQPRFITHIRRVDCIEKLLGPGCDLPTGSNILCVTDLDQPLLKNFTTEKLDALKILFQHAKGILWVCQGARGDEPYSAMMFGLSRTIRVEYSNLNLQMLDIDTVDERAASRIASISLRLQIWDSWAREASQTNMLWSVERELVIEQGQTLIPRLYPKASSNLRYNTSRRIVSIDIDPQKVPIQLRPVETTPSTIVESLVPREIPRLQAPDYPISPINSVRVTLSMSSFIRIGDVGSFMLCAGIDISTKTPVFCLSFAANSPAPTVSALTVQQSDLRLSPAEGLISLFSCISARQVLDCAPSARSTVLVHGADAMLARALRFEATKRGLDLILTSSTREDGGSDKRMLHLHAKLSKSVLRKIIPRTVSVLVDLTTVENSAGQSDTSRILRTCLPQDCDFLTGSNFFSSAVRMLHQSSDIRRIRSILQAAMESATALVPTAPPSSNVVPLSKMATTTIKPSPCPMVLDWTETSVPIEMLPVDEGTIFRTDKTYALVGLAGELGQSLARWMVQRGAKSIVLSSRNPVVDPQYLDSLSREWGAMVKVMAFDVTNPGEVHAAFATIERTMPPIAGIANGAMVLRDSTFENMTLSDWQACVRPKVEGTLILDELFHTTQLDFFITFSSLTCVIGNIGQANYAAANAFMAALCAQRRNQRGVAGSTMDLSSVVGLGVVERSDIVNAGDLAGRGVRSIAETDVHQLFAEAIVAGRPGSGEMAEIVTGIKPMINSTPEEKSRGDVALDPRFGHFVQERPSSAPEAVDLGTKHTSTIPTRTLLLKAPTFQQAEQIIKDSLLARLARILHTESIIGNDSPLVELGIDSLVAVELRNWFVKELDVHVPVMRIISNGTINDLARFATEKQKIVDVNQPSNLPTPNSVTLDSGPRVGVALRHTATKQSTLQVLSNSSMMFPF